MKHLILLVAILVSGCSQEDSEGLKAELKNAQTANSELRERVDYLRSLNDGYREGEITAVEQKTDKPTYAKSMSELDKSLLEAKVKNLKLQIEELKVRNQERENAYTIAAKERRASLAEIEDQIKKYRNMSYHAKTEDDVRILGNKLGDLFTKVRELKLKD